VSEASKGFGSSGLVRPVQDSQWPVSNSVLTSVRIAAHGTMLAGFAVLYSGWKLNGVPLQLAIEVLAKPLAADACIQPLVCSVRSSMVTLNAFPPPGAAASAMWMTTSSPGFMSSVCELGVKLATVASCGLGAPVGTPLVWMNAKFTGSSQSALHVANPAVHSRLSMVSAAHQCVVSQPELSTKGGSPGG